VAVYFLGPTPDKPKWDKAAVTVPADPTALENYVAALESKHRLKPDNEARIVWADSTRKKTKYSVVYLHGFSASQKEGDPIHLQFAKEFGCNLYLARLADHGVDTTEQLLYFTGDRWWQSSKEALAIGKALGENVILMSTSTGGTMAIMLAAEYPGDVYAMINMSPNIAVNDPSAWLLNNPWGLQIARKVLGSDYQNVQYDSARQIYWNGKYRIESLVQMEEMLEDKMTKSTFEKVKCPSLTLYYYKNEQEQDKTVKVSAMLEMNKQLGTPDSLKVAVAIPNAGFHVMGSYLVSKDLETVSDEAKKFAIEKLGMKPIH
jgi:esterase/lipase